MQTLLLGLTTFACILLTIAWSHHSSANVADTYIRPHEFYGTSSPKENSGRKAIEVNAPSSFSGRLIAKKIETKLEPVQNNSNIQATLPEISRITLRHHFGLDEDEPFHTMTLEQLADSFLVDEKCKKASGLFVTLIKDGDTRACWGSIAPTHKNLIRATVFTTEDALKKDYRYSPIKKDEINQLIPQITVVKRIVPINSISTMRPLKEGLMVRSGGKGAVLLPGEASDAHYQLVKCKLKAGIPSGQPCQLYKIEADVYR